jgi:tRNA 2-selenouridine synthase
MRKQLSIHDFLLIQESFPIIDVRSPGEYEIGHIPGAVNIPLFNDAERKIIGTIYKREGRNEAINKGFEIVQGKIETIIDQALQVAKSPVFKPGRNNVRMYCWRGGMRSGAMAWLFEKYGIDCYVLSGGYKAFRTYVHQFLDQPFHFILLGGMTGSGKTDILGEMKKRGQQVIDLEALARHKGSAFGALGENPQPSTEHFENLLFTELSKINIREAIWLEDESRTIGKITIPPEIYSRTRQSAAIILETDREKRIAHLIQNYGSYSPDEIINCILKIEKRLGGQNTKTAIQHALDKNYEAMLEIILSYYDKTYQYGLNKKTLKNIHYIRAQSTAEKNAESILRYVKAEKL